MFNRSIGRWSLTALIINCIIGAGIFGVPGELMATMGRASPAVMVVAGLLMSTILLCFAEVGSRFSEAGGVYLYARTAFGSFVGLQVGWFWFLAVLGGAAANLNLFVAHLSGLAPWAAHGWQRLLVLTVLLLIPAAVNFAGTRRGAFLSNGLTVAKLLPLIVLIALGVIRFSGHAELATISELTRPGWAAWVNSLLLLVFVYGGFEDAMTTSGEVRNPHRNVPLALITGLAVCMAIYSLLQFTVVATLGSAPSERPLAAVAQTLLGRGGALFVEMAAMMSTYGWLSASMLNVPRFLFSMAAHREFPRAFGRLHARFGTPYISLLAFTTLAWLLGVTRSFRWCVELSAGAGIVFYVTVCAALPRLRRIPRLAAGLRLPFGPVCSVVGVAICLVLVTQLEAKQWLLMLFTALIAAANWGWVRRRQPALTAGQPVAILPSDPPQPRELL